MTDIKPCGWRYVPSEVWGDQVLTQDPKTAQLARECGRVVQALYDQAALDAAVAAERERCARLQQVWEDTRTQRDELLAHIAGKAPLPQWAADWLKA